MLDQLCRLAGFNFSDCFQGNTLNIYPNEGKFLLASDSVREQSKQSLLQDLETFRPSLILALDKYAGQFFKPSLSDLDDERGSPFISSIYPHCPCIITLSPRSIFKRYEYLTVVIEDFKKAWRLAQEGWKERTCEINFRPTFQACIEFLNRCIDNRPYLSVDIETKGTHISCIGFAWTPSNAIVIPFDKELNQPCWSITEEKYLWQKIAQVLKSCPLVGQNCLHFDRKHLLKNYKIYSNFVDDTMFAAWECYPELPKGLAFLNSLYTDNAYHKDILSQARSGKIAYSEEYRYCGLDCCYTYEIIQNLAREIKSQPAPVYSHYRFNIKVSHVFDYMSAVGCEFDWAKRDKRLSDLEDKASQETSEIQRAVGWKINPKSPKQVSKLLYEDFKLPEKFKIKFSEAKQEEYESLTSDYLTILYFARLYPNNPIILKVGMLRKLQKRISSLKKIEPRPDGRIGWDFVVPGTVTGRTSGKKPLDGLGIQPQNLDRDDRDLCIAGAGWEMLKADLEGADSWTCAVMLKALGQSTLWDDLLAGLKPAQVLALSILLRNDDLVSAPREELLKLKHCLKTPEGKRTYQYSKNVGHGSAYMMRGNRMHETIFKESDGEIYIPKNECERLQKLFYRRYPFPQLHDYMRNRLVQAGYLDSVSGTRRYFLGRKDDSTLRDMLAHAPQAHTTYSANVVLDRISSTNDNRRDSKLVLQPINQVHDETLLKYRVETRDFSHQMFRDNCRVELEYWGTKFTIPFEAMYGDDWGNCNKPIQL